MHRSTVTAALLSALLCTTALVACKPPSLGSFTSSSSTAGGGGGGGGGDLTCCVNGSFYECPSLDAVDRCSGALSRCMAGCMSSDDMACPDTCVAQHPADPSGCSRDVGRDGTCSR